MTFLCVHSMQTIIFIIDLVPFSSSFYCFWKISNPWDLPLLQRYSWLSISAGFALLDLTTHELKYLKNYGKFKKQNLNLLHVGNYLYSVSIVLGILSNMEYTWGHTWVNMQISHCLVEGTWTLEGIPWSLGTLHSPLENWGVTVSVVSL